MIRALPLNFFRRSWFGAVSTEKLPISLYLQFLSSGRHRRLDWHLNIIGIQIYSLQQTFYFSSLYLIQF